MSHQPARRGCLTGTITAWSSGGVEVELDWRTLTLHGLREGSCPEYGQQLMSAWTHGREAGAAVMHNGTAWLWVETADDRWQFANPWAARFGVGSATQAEGPHMGLLSDESAAPKPEFRPKTWEASTNGAGDECDVQGGPLDEVAVTEGAWPIPPERPGPRSHRSVVESVWAWPPVELEMSYPPLLWCPRLRRNW